MDSFEGRTKFLKKMLSTVLTCTPMCRPDAACIVQGDNYYAAREKERNMKKGSRDRRSGMREFPLSMLGSGHVSCYLTRYSRIPVALRCNGTRTNSIRVLSPGTNIRTWPFVLLNNSLISRHFSQPAFFSGSGGATIRPYTHDTRFIHKTCK